MSLNIDSSGHTPSCFCAKRSTFAGKLRNGLLRWEKYTDGKRAEWKAAGDGTLGCGRKVQWFAMRSAGRGSVASLTPFISTVDIGTNLSLTGAKLLVGAILSAINGIYHKCINQEVEKLISHPCWHTREAIPHLKNAGFSFINIFCSPVVTVKDPNRLYPKNWYRLQIETPKQKELETLFNDFMESVSPFYDHHKISEENRITRDELQLIHDTLKQRAAQVSSTGRDEVIKINPKKDPDLLEKGIHHSAVIKIEQGQFDSSKIIIHTRVRLGRGASRYVEDARYLNGKQVIHQKLIYKEKVLDSDTKVELEILEAMDHPNIMKLELKRDKADRKNARPGLYYEALPYELDKVTPEKSSDEHKKKVAQQLLGIAEGLNHCHKQNIFHRDIKCDNLRLSEEGVAKLIDFGAAIDLNHSEVEPYKFTGTLIYCPPELLILNMGMKDDQIANQYKGKVPQDKTLAELYEKQDCWAFALTVFERLNTNDSDELEDRLPEALRKISKEAQFTFQIPAKIAKELDFAKDSEDIRNFRDQHGRLGELIYNTFINDFDARPTMEDFIDALQKYIAS